MRSKKEGAKSKCLPTHLPSAVPSAGRNGKTTSLFGVSCSVFSLKNGSPAKRWQKEIANT
jgi:hypothetical protein